MIIITILITRDNFNSLHWIADRTGNDFIPNCDINGLYSVSKINCNVSGYHNDI